MRPFFVPALILAVGLILQIADESLAVRPAGEQAPACCQGCQGCPFAGACQRGSPLEMPVSAERSGAWRRVRAEHLRQHPVCEACGADRELEVHHILPVHVEPDRELDPTNLITLCEDCHMFWGHLRSYDRWNPDVRRHAKWYRGLVEAAKRRTKEFAADHESVAVEAIP